jgi:hypothetical protein
MRPNSVAQDELRQSLPGSQLALASGTKQAPFDSPGPWSFPWSLSERISHHLRASQSPSHAVDDLRTAPGRGSSGALGPIQNRVPRAPRGPRSSMADAGPAVTSRRHERLAPQRPKREQISSAGRLPVWTRCPPQQANSLHQSRRGGGHGNVPCAPKRERDGSATKHPSLVRGGRLRCAVADAC